jgi:hypothetical protein
MEKHNFINTAIISQAKSFKICNFHFAWPFTWQQIIAKSHFDEGHFDTVPSQENF